MPAEQFLFGENWTRDVDLQAKEEQAPTPQEGLLSALNNVTPNRFPRVLVVDDTPKRAVSSGASSSRRAI
jgi:hypothetical protein